MNKIPTAKQFITNNSHLPNEQMLIEFAKLHVQACTEAHERISNDFEKYSAYPLTNIK